MGHPETEHAALCDAPDTGVFQKQARAMMLKNRMGLVVGVANGKSIAAGWAAAFAREGAKVIVTHMNDRARPHVATVPEAVGAVDLLPLDLSVPDQQGAVFDAIGARSGRLDFLLPSVAFCPRGNLHGRVADCSAAGFAQAMDISCHSFLRLARAAEPLMATGGISTRPFPAPRAFTTSSPMACEATRRSRRCWHAAAGTGDGPYRPVAASPPPRGDR